MASWMTWINGAIPVDPAIMPIVRYAFGLYRSNSWGPWSSTVSPSLRLPKCRSSADESSCAARTCDTHATTSERNVVLFWSTTSKNTCLDNRHTYALVPLNPTKSKRYLYLYDELCAYTVPRRNWCVLLFYFLVIDGGFDGHRTDRPGAQNRVCWKVEQNFLGIRSHIFHSADSELPVLFSV